MARQSILTVVALACHPTGWNSVHMMFQTALNAYFI